jgi:glycerol-3-phosphate acyltransferase PlsX
MRIALDAMGGDNAPAAIIHGGIEAARLAKGEYEVVFVGDREQIEREIARHFFTSELSVSIHHAGQKIDMAESPAVALRQKKDSSIAVATRLHKEGGADAVISAGNTGAAMASAVMTLGRIKGVQRPAIGALLPHLLGVTLLLDAGANVDCKPSHLLQFGIMGSVFYSHLFDSGSPRVALLSIGEEDSKGDAVTLEANRLFKRSRLNFVGNMEGGDILRGDSDVIVCDGFVGNILLKFAESIDKVYRSTLRRKIGKHIFRQMGAFLLKPTFERLRKIFDYQEYGGAPLLGVNGVCIVCHGRSTPHAIKNAVREAVRIVREGVNQHIHKELQYLTGESVA